MLYFKAMANSHHDAHGDYLPKLKTILASAKNEKNLYEAIVNSPFNDKGLAVSIGLGVVVLLLINKVAKTIDRIALSDTEAAKGAVEYSVKPFKEIRIPLNFKGNIIAEAIKTGTPQHTADWKNMFIPALTAEEARFNQAGAGIGCSLVYPLLDSKIKGAIIFSYYIQPEEISEKHRKFMHNYTSIVSEAFTESPVFAA